MQVAKGSGGFLRGVNRAYKGLFVLCAGLIEVEGFYRVVELYKNATEFLQNVHSCYRKYTRQVKKFSGGFWWVYKV